MRPERPFVVERAVVTGRRYRVQFDARAELEAIWRALRDVPREHLASKEDLINYLHRCAGRIPPLLERLEVVAAASVQAPRVRLGRGLVVDHATVVAGVFGPPKRPARERTRTVVSRRGQRVRVVERAAGQLELRL